MTRNKNLEPILRCPECRSGSLVQSAGEEIFRCSSCGQNFPIIAERPILLRSDNRLFKTQDYMNIAEFSTMPDRTLRKKIWRLLPSPSVNLARDRVLKTIRETINAFDEAKVLVVGVGKQRSKLEEGLAPGASVQVIYSDVDNDAGVDLICDGHDLPFIDGSFDAVVTTAVIEHVLYPERVAKEMQRVLKVYGLLYSELPFMQQVHAGAYDFTRYTFSGHRRLFNEVAVLEKGMVAGPATALVWSLETFAMSFTSGKLARNVIKAGNRVFFGWLKYFDYMFAKRPQAMDGASCTYLLGRKIDGQISDSEIVANYIGANSRLNTQW